MPTKEELKALQALPLERKILITQTRLTKKLEALAKALDCTVEEISE